MRTKRRAKGRPRSRQSVYLPKEMIEQVYAEARRFDRSLSWVLQLAWKNSRNQLRTFPGANDPLLDSAGPQRRTVH